MTPREFEEARAELNLNYAQMAKCLDVSPATVANWANGRTRISLPTAEYIKHMLYIKRNPDPKKEAAEKMNQLFNSKKKEHPTHKRCLIHNIGLALQNENAKVLIVDDKSSADFLNQELNNKYFVAIMLPTSLPEINNTGFELLKDRECICLPSFNRSRRSKSAKKVLSDNIINLEEIENPAKMICFFVNEGKIIKEQHEAEVSKEQVTERGVFIYDLPPIDFWGHIIRPFSMLLNGFLSAPVALYSGLTHDNPENLNLEDTDFAFLQKIIKRARGYFEKYTGLPKDAGDAYIGEIPNGEDGIEVFIVIKNSGKGGNGQTVLYSPFEFPWLKEYEVPMD